MGCNTNGFCSWNSWHVYISRADNRATVSRGFLFVDRRVQ